MSCSLFDRSTQNDPYDLYGNYPLHRRLPTSRNLSSGSERWRATLQERVDNWREMRRDAIRERQRLSRERAILSRRRRSIFFVQSELIEPVTPQAAQLAVHFIAFTTHSWRCSYLRDLIKDFPLVEESKERFKKQIAMHNAGFKPMTS